MAAKILAFFKRHGPITLKTGMFTALTAGTGDFFCQAMQQSTADHVGREFEWDKKQTAIMANTGACVVAPMNIAFYNVMEKMVPGNHTASIFKKTLASSAVTPLYVTAVFTSVALQNGHSLEELKSRIHQLLLPTASAGAVYWSAVGAINFTLMPVYIRPFISAVAGMLWNVYLSAKANKRHSMIAQEADANSLIAKPLSTHSKDSS